MGTMRLDRLLSQALAMTRSEVKKEIRQGNIRVNDAADCRPEQKVDPEADRIVYRNTPVILKKTVWLMFHKPAGCVTATDDMRHKTVLDYISHPRRKELFPAGRLDLDTEGLLFLTNDGETVHRMLSPKHHVEKTYYVRTQGRLTEADVRAFADGIDIGDEKPALPAKLVILSSGLESEAEVTVSEGRFHQVKRMFLARNCRVCFLKRICMAGISLDPALAPGAWRELTEEETERMLAVCWNRQRQ